MAEIRAAFGTSHAFTLMGPETWDAFRARNKEHYLRRFGHLPTDNERVQDELLDTKKERYERIRAGLDDIRRALIDDHPDALVIIADDQNEHLTRANLPQIVVFTGGGAFIGQTREKSLQILEGVVNKDGGISGLPVKFLLLADQTSPQVAKQLGSQQQTLSPIVLGSSPF